MYNTRSKKYESNSSKTILVNFDIWKKGDAMDNAKVNLLFDGRIIAEFLKTKKKHPSGLFFVSLNLLKTFLDDARFNVSLCLFDRKRIWCIRRFFSAEKLKIIIIQDKTVFVKNIDSHKQNIQTSKNMFKKLLYCLKLLKNLLRLAGYEWFKTNISKLKDFNAFLSPGYEILEEVRKHPHIRRFILIHDVIPFLNLSCYEGHPFNDFFLHAVFKKLDYDYYFFVSENSKKDFIRYACGRVDEKKMQVTYIASANNFVPQYDKEKLALVLKKYSVDFNQKRKYIFSFCSLEPRKNIVFTVRCFVKFIQKNNIADLYFFLGGAAWKNYHDIYKKEINSISDEHESKIIHLGYVDDEDVNVLYSNSLFFAYISKYEGFGMPPLEAMQAGTPVITSNNSSLPEVVGDAAIMIDCESEDQCVKAFETLYYNENLRKDYIKKGIERAELFTWKKTVDKMSEVILLSVINQE
jgi:glycosyltransferase involved in cell wall biosynthesis